MAVLFFTLLLLLLLLSKRRVFFFVQRSFRNHDRKAGARPHGGAGRGKV